MSLDPWLSNLNSIAGALRRCGGATRKSLHSQLIKRGLSAVVFLANNLIAMYSDLGLHQDAHKVFDEMPHRNVASWTTAISLHTHAGNPAEALRVFSHMLDHSHETPNSFTFSAALKACAAAGDLELGKWIHERVSRTQLQFDTVLVNAVLDMYIKCGTITEARRVFEIMSLPNCTSWNIMIAGYSRAGDMVEAENLFCEVPEPDAASFNTMIAGFAQTDSPRALDYVRMMHERGIGFDHFTFSCALKTCGSLRFEKLGMQIHSYVIRSGFVFDCFTRPALIDMYANCGRMNEATRVYDESKSRTVFYNKLPLVNSMVSGFTINGYDRRALELLSEVHRVGVRFDVYTLSSALKVCTNLQNLKIGMQVHGLIVTSGYHLDHIVGTALLVLYAKCGNLEDGLRIFFMLPHKDVVSWAGLITGYVQHGWNQSAFSLFREMIRLNVEADHFIASNILKTCSVLAWLHGGKQVHAYSVKGGYESESVVVASLIDMYSKCGEIDDGIRVFETVIVKDTVCWTGIIVGCGYNGRSNEAIDIFHDMLESGEKPNEITFLGVLSACRHAGLVGEACVLFKSMLEEHGLIPLFEHYCCMIDILSRAGLYEEVKQLIVDMPYAPDETIRNSLFGAGGIQHKADVGNLPLELIPFSKPPHDASGLVALSNAYASLGMWDVSAKFREISCRVSIKEAGRSWVEVGA